MFGGVPVEAAPLLDKGWSYVGMGQFGASMSSLDSLIYAFGRIGDKKEVSHSKRARYECPSRPNALKGQNNTGGLLCPFRA